jgi:hypothetical protein
MIIIIIIINHRSAHVTTVTTEGENRSFSKPCNIFHRKYENTVKKITPVFFTQMLMVTNVQQVRR